MPPFVLLLSMTACKRPPEAPAELNELAGFLFERFMDEDTRDLELGVENLADWLRSNLEETEDGYSVDDLDEAVIKSVAPHREPNLERLGGAAVATVSTYDVRPIARALVVREQEEVFPDNYESHDRTFVTDPDCFMPHDCDFVDTKNRVEASYGGLIKTSTHSQAQYRWIPFGEDDFAFLHRTWLIDPAEVNPDWVKVHEQLYVGVTIPWDAGALRLGTTWIAADVLDGLVSEGTALQLMIDSMQKEGENLDAFLSQ